MNDPRDEQIDSDDVLTEDSSDELKDLVQEFELKYAELKKNKALKKRRSQSPLEDMLNKQKPHQPEVPRTPEKAKVHLDKVIEEPKQRIFPKKEPRDSKIKESNFLNKLYETSNKHDEEDAHKIDFSKRRFEFQLDKYTFTPKDVVDDLEPISKLYLRRRYLAQLQIADIIAETDSNMKFLKIDKFLAKTHKSNNYAEPKYCNWCLVAFVVRKDPVQVAANNSKYIKLKVGNFMNSVDLMLFDKAFQKNGKIQPGDLLFILNPLINKYEIQVGKGQFQSGFNLKVENTNVSSILEIGSLRDFGFCKFTRKLDNSRCKRAINTRTQEFCDIHLDMKFKSSTRMELNGSVSIRSPQKNKKKMYMNKNGSGFIKQYNEESTVIGTSYGSPLDPKRYQDPKVLQNQIKRRKLIDDKAKEMLEQKLSKLGSASLLNNLQLSKKEATDKLASDRLKSKGFTNTMISHIGFDPTGTSLNQNSTLLGSKLMEKSRARELHDLSVETSGHKSLSSSKQDRQSKVAKWNTNIRTLQNYDRRVASHSLSTSRRLQNLVGKQTHATLVDKRKRVVVSDDEQPGMEEDEEDIEIQFDDEKSKMSYMKMTGAR